VLFVIANCSNCGQQGRVELSLTLVKFVVWPVEKLHMTYRFPKLLVVFQVTAALAMLIALYIGTRPMIWGWLLFAPLFLFIVAKGVRTYLYSLTINGDCITVVDLNKRADYLVSDITAINVWPAKGERVAVVTFWDWRKLSFPSHLEGFDDLVDALRKQTKLQKQT